MKVVHGHVFDLTNGFAAGAVPSKSTVLSVQTGEGNCLVLWVETEASDYASIDAASPFGMRPRGVYMSKKGKQPAGYEVFVTTWTRGTSGTLQKVWVFLQKDVDDCTVPDAIDCAGQSSKMVASEKVPSIKEVAVALFAQGYWANYASRPTGEFAKQAVGAAKSLVSLMKEMDENGEL